MRFCVTRQVPGVPGAQEVLSTWWPLLLLVIAVIVKVCGKLGSQAHLAGGWCQGALGVR